MLPCNQDCSLASPYSVNIPLLIQIDSFVIDIYIWQGGSGHERIRPAMPSRRPQVRIRGLFYITHGGNRYAIIIYSRTCINTWSPPRHILIHFRGYTDRLNSWNPSGRFDKFTPNMCLDWMHFHRFDYTLAPRCLSRSKCRFILAIGTLSPFTHTCTWIDDHEWPGSSTCDDRGSRSSP